jgi:pyruvate dehydrogenase E2 component (dihydrolipoamide acetyltransferase)
LRGDERQETTKSAFKMEPFREVRSPERNFGPARLAGGTVTTPLARRLAGEAGIDLSNVKGSGPHGRIVARDVEAARAKSAVPAPTQAQAAANVVVTADVEIGQAQALCQDVPAIELTDIVIKAWAAALQRVTPSEKSDIALIGKGRAVIRDAASKSLTAIAKARGDLAETNDFGASTAISIAAVPGIISVTDVLQPPQTTILAVGSARRTPVEAADGSVKFVSVTTVTLSCDHRVVGGALGAELLAAFKRFVEQPVMMIV